MSSRVALALLALAIHAGCRQPDPPPPSAAPSPAHGRAVAETGRLEVTLKRVIEARRPFTD